MELLGQLGGRLNGLVAASGDAVYVPFGRQVWIYDVSDPSHPKRAGMLGVEALDLTVAGDTLLINTPNALLMFDIRHPTQPVALSTLAWSGPRDQVWTGQVRAQGNLAFAVTCDYCYSPPALAVRRRAIEIIDLGDPKSPLRLGEVVVSDAWTFDVTDFTVYGTRLIAATSSPIAPYTNTIETFDIADPRHPVRAGRHEIFGQTFDFEAAGTAGYLLRRDDDQHFSLHVLDLSDAANPHEMATVPASTGAWRMVVDRDRLYLAGGGVVTAFDLAVPLAPRLLGSLVATGTVDEWMQLAVAGTRVYLAGYLNVVLADFSQPDQPRQFAVLEPTRQRQSATFAYARYIAVRGNTAYLADQDGLRVVEVGNPQMPVELGVVRPPTQTHGTARVAQSAAQASAFPFEQSDRWPGFDSVVIDGDRAYAAYYDGLAVYDLAPRDRPQLVDAYALWPLTDEMGCTDYDVENSVVYCVGAGLAALDFSDPHQPHLLSTLHLPVIGDIIRVVDHRAYVGSRNGWFYILDVSIPTRPRVMAEIRVTGVTYIPPASSLDVNGRLAVLAAGDDDTPGATFIIDISQPTNPFVRAVLPGVLFPQVALFGSTAFIASADHTVNYFGVSQLDLRDPDRPQVVSRESDFRAARANALAATDGRLFLANNQDAFLILRPPPLPPASRLRLWLPVAVR